MITTTDFMNLIDVLSDYVWSSDKTEDIGSRFELETVCFDFLADGLTLNLIATNGHSMVCFRMSLTHGSATGATILLNPKDFKGLNKFILTSGLPVMVVPLENAVLFTDGVSAETLQGQSGEYPDYEKIINCDCITDEAAVDPRYVTQLSKIFFKFSPFVKGKTTMVPCGKNNPIKISTVPESPVINKIDIVAMSLG